MGKAVNIDAITGEITEHEIEDVVGDESGSSLPTPSLITDPVEKLRAFLSANPDVANLLQGDA